jgi:ABC-2 type transport system permease protein
MNMLKLINIQVRVGLGLSALAWYRKNKDKRFWGAIGIVLLVILGLSPLFLLYLRLMQVAYHATAMLGQSEVVLTSALVFSSILVFFFGIAYIMSTFYFSRDLSFLIPLPLLPRDILGAKFAVVLINNYITIVPFYLSALLVYGINSGASSFYWLRGIIIFLLVPLIPLALNSTIILVLMRITNIAGRKDTLRVISMIFFLAVIMVFNFFITRIPEGQELEFIQGLLAVEGGLVNYVGRPFPPAILATRALASGGATAAAHMLGYLGLSLAGLILVFFLGDRLFYHGLIGGEEVGGRKKISARVLDRKISHQGSAIYAIASREIKILIRTPIYMFNSVGMLLILPIILAIPILSQGGLGQLVTQIDSMERIILNLAAVAFIAISATFTPASSSAFSREGKLAWVSQVIPVHPVTQINGKVLYSYIITMMAVPLLLLFSLGIANWTAAELALIIILGAAVSFPAITSSLLIDLLKPYLTWDNPQKAIKQNINVLLGMVASAGSFYIIYRAANLAHSQQENDLLVYLAVFAAAFILGLIPYLIMIRIAVPRYRELSN